MTPTVETLYTLLKRCVLLGLLTFTLTSAFAKLPESYDRLFPYAAKVCGFSMRDGGNLGGHILIILKGVCTRPNRDGPPDLELCGDEKMRADPSLGTGLSSNPELIDRGYVAIQGVDFVLNGGLQSGDSEDERHEAILDQAVASGAFNAPQFTDDLQKVWNKESLHVPASRFIAARSLGTDFALAVGRQGSCWNIPVTQAQTLAMMNRAIEINQYIKAGHPYRWNFLTNSCDHFVAHILAAGGLKKDNLGLVEGPSTTMVRIGDKVRGPLPSRNDLLFSMSDLLSIRAHKQRLRDALSTFGRLPYAYGTVLEVMPFHTTGNSFKPHSSRFGNRSDDPKAIREMERDPLLTDVVQSMAEYGRKFSVLKDTYDRKRESEISGRRMNLKDFDPAIHDAYDRWIGDTQSEINSVFPQVFLN